MHLFAAAAGVNPTRNSRPHPQPPRGHPHFSGRLHGSICQLRGHEDVVSMDFQSKIGFTFKRPVGSPCSPRPARHGAMRHCWCAACTSVVRTEDPVYFTGSSAHQRPPAPQCRNLFAANSNHHAFCYVSARSAFVCTLLRILLRRLVATGCVKGTSASPTSLHVC